MVLSSNDPPRVLAAGLRLAPGAENAIDLYRAQAAVDDAGPAGFVGRIGVRREDPLRARIAGGLEYSLQRLRGDAAGMAGLDAGGADGCGNAGLHLGESRAGRFIRLRGKKLCVLLQERVHRFAERAREQPAFVALVEAARAEERLVGRRSRELRGRRTVVRR